MNRRGHLFALGMTVLMLDLLGIGSVKAAEPQSARANWENLKGLARGDDIRIVLNDTKSYEAKFQSVSDAAIVVRLAMGEQVFTRNAALMVPPQESQPLESAPPGGEPQVARESARPVITTEQAKQEQPAQLPAAVPERAADTTQVKIPGGTAVHLVVKNPISSESAKNKDIVEFVVAEPLIVNGFTVIPAGAIARGVVVQVKKSTEKKDGLLAWTPKDVGATDGTLVPLRLLKMPGLGGKKLTAGDVGWVALGIAILPLGPPNADVLDSLFQGRERGPRGRAAELRAGERFLVFVNSDVAVATKGAAVSGPGVGGGFTCPAVTTTNETPKPQDRWRFVSFDWSYYTQAESFSELEAKISKAAADGYRLMVASDEGLLLEKAATPPDLYRYRLVNTASFEYRKTQAALNQGGVWGYRWWRNTLGQAWWDEFICVMEKAPGRPNQFQYACPPEPGTFETTEDARQVDRVNRRMAELYREGYREGYQAPRGPVLERAAEISPSTPALEELDPTEPYLWLPGLSMSPPQVAPEIRAAAARGYRVVRCSWEDLEGGCLLAKPAKPAVGTYEYQFLSLEPAGQNTHYPQLDEAGAKGYRLRDVRNTRGGSAGQTLLDVMLEKDPQGRGRYVYQVFMDNTVEGLLGAMNGAAEQGYVLRKFTCSARPQDHALTKRFAIMEKTSD